MTTGTQCDNCRTFGPHRPPGWFYVAQQPGEDEVPSVLSALLGNPKQPLTFCSIGCLADWAFVRKAAAELTPGTEPSP